MGLATTTGHDGLLLTIHARSPEAAQRRLETLCLMADVALPPRPGGPVSDAVGLVVQQPRAADRHRPVTAVARAIAWGGRWRIEPVDIGTRTLSVGPCDGSVRNPDRNGPTVADGCGWGESARAAPRGAPCRAA